MPLRTPPPEYRRGSEGYSCNTITSRPSLNRERNSMSGEQLERSILERKEREELKAIATAMSLEPVARLKKADLVDQILRAAGVEMGAAGNGSNGGTAQPATASPMQRLTARPPSRAPPVRARPSRRRRHPTLPRQKASRSPRRPLMAARTRRASWVVTPMAAAIVLPSGGAGQSRRPRTPAIPPHLLRTGRANR